MNCRHGIDTTADGCVACALDDANSKLHDLYAENERLKEREKELLEAALNNYKVVSWYDKEISRLKAELATMKETHKMDIACYEAAERNATNARARAEAAERDAYKVALERIAYCQCCTCMIQPQKTAREALDRGKR